MQSRPKKPQKMHGGQKCLRGGEKNRERLGCCSKEFFCSKVVQGSLNPPLLKTLGTALCVTQCGTQGQANKKGHLFDFSTMTTKYSSRSSYTGLH